jgi:tetratricopeptide (TPR) repeat protein
VLVLALVATYWVALRGDFLWDDDLHITANPTIIGPLGLTDIWTSARANYFPLVLTNFWVQHALWGLAPFGYHVVTLVCHILAALLLWRVLAQLRVPGAWLGAALWALHPVQVESVAWICELKNTQSAVFFLLAIGCWLTWLGPVGQGLPLPAGAAGKKPVPHPRHYALALFCALLAILSKPSTVMLPVVLGLLTWWVHRRLTWRDLVPLLPFLALSAAAAVWTIWEQRVNSGAEGAEWAQTWPERFAIAGRVIWFYLGKLAWPAELMFIYPRWAIDAARPLAFAPLVAALVTLGVLWWRRHTGLRPVFVTVIFFGALLFPVLGFFSVYFFRYSFVGDHFQYLASMGPLALAGAGLTVALERVRGAAAWLQPLVPAVVLALLGVLSWRESHAYTNSETLWRTTLARNPDAFMAWANLGATLAEQDRHPEVILAFRRALQLRPQDAPVLNDLGCSLVVLNRSPEAIPLFERALQFRPGYGEVYNNLGNALSRVGRGDDAIAHYERAVKFKPTHAEAHNNLGCELVLAGRLPEALARLEEAIRLKPGAVKYRRDLGAALGRAGRLPEAILQFEHVARLAPARPASHAVLGGALASAGRWDEALARFQTALSLAPGDAELHGNAGVALANLGKLPEAIAAFQQAIRLRPAYIDAHSNLAQILRSLGRNLEAADHFDEAERHRQAASRRP